MSTVRELCTVRELFTPERAAAVLAVGRNSRPLNPSRVAALAAAMLAGTFDSEAGLPVSFRAGHPRNGQHRMAAIVLSGVTLELPVRWR